MKKTIDDWAQSMTIVEMFYNFLDDGKSLRKVKNKRGN
ncbi:hypothetical protein Gotur_021341 [Gossypium turneri]